MAGSGNLASLRMPITTAPSLINANHVALATWRLIQEVLKKLNLDFVQYHMVHDKDNQY